MKILSIELCNINSLAGEWSIDFTDPSFVKNNNIFVIHGKTGSGKSSILDALTLALYGRTPRQDRINSSRNEVMTRNKSRCYARVKYSCKKGTYISEWNQRRSRDKASGKLQDPDCTIRKEDGTPVYTGKAANLAEETARIIELDYLQFVRSILLAQGEFSRFLDCKPDERAKILEKLDGSEDYRKIAARIAARASDEEAKFSRHKADYEAVLGTVLSEDVVLEKQAAEEGLSGEKIAAGTRLNSLRELEMWYTELERLQTNRDNAETALIQAVADVESFAPLQSRLSAGEKAFSCEPAYDKCQAAADRLEKERTDLQSNRQQLLDAQKTLDDCHEKVGTLSSEVRQAREKQQNELDPLWQKVLNMDSQIEGMDAGKKNLRKEMEACDAALREAMKERDEVESVLSRLKTERKGYAAYAAENSGDGEIEKDLSVLKDKISRLNRDVEELGRVDSEIRTHSRQQQDIASQMQESRGLMDTLQLWLKENAGDESLPEVIAETAERTSRLQNIQKERDAISQEQGKDGVSLKSAAESLDSQKTVRMELLGELEAGFADDALYVAAELQKRLEPGIPCPVCGSLEHPACGDSVHGNHNDDEPSASFGAVMERTASFAERLKKLRQKLDDAEKTISRTETDITVLQSRMAENEKRLDSLDDERQNLWQQITQKAARWVTSSEEKDGQQILSLLRKESSLYISRKQKFEDEDSRLSELNVTASSLEGILSQKTLRHDELDAEVKALQKSITQLCTPFFHGELPSDSWDNILSSLGHRAELWAQNEGNITSVRDEISSLETECAGLNEKINGLTEKAAGLQKNLLEQESALNELTGQRKALFGDDSVEENRTSFLTKLHSFEEKLRTATKEETEAGNLVTALNTSIKENERHISETSMEHQQCQKLLQEKLMESGFCNVEEFRLNRVSPVELQELKERSRTLEENRTRAEATFSGAEKYLSEHRKLHADVPEKEVLSQERISLEQELSQIEEKLSLLKGELANHEKQKKQAESMVEAYEAQQKIRDRWHRLAELMGNKDGSSFSIFVQGITFRNLLTYANRHLSFMKDRYSLRAKGDLDFEVLDASFDAPRSVSNISGGERFLISLALALSIADLASHSVRVDSLFLDEGFGSLDGEILQNVLDCLKRQQLKNGKMLGVITHVDAVVDSIDQRIEVKPVSGGYSIISGEGITRRNTL